MKVATENTDKMKLIFLIAELVFGRFDLSSYRKSAKEVDPLLLSLLLTKKTLKELAHGFSRRRMVLATNGQSVSKDETVSDCSR